ncbi:MAG TPA: NAD-dependent dehydratase [Verrucomicrobia subdivision 3 bacterium]|nr:NAD-dependent dehydratase [Limisphaerales bacterium]
MKILFIGGTGTISSACAQLALERGFELTLLNRGRQPGWPGARQITADIGDAAATAAALGDKCWDVVVDYIAFTPAEVEQRIALFRGRTAQFIFISSASAYQKPPVHFPITESTPLVNPFWDYSRNKIACEERLLRALQEENFPATIIRPSWTYDEQRITVPVNSKKSFTVLDRLRRGRPVIVPGDGTSLWTMTHNTDFAKGLVGLLGHQGAIGHTFHITSDEVLTWNQIYETVAAAAGVAKPRLVHIASDFITACLPEFAGGLHGDKAHSAVFDNTKIKRFVPAFVATTRFRDGMARSVRWFDADPARQEIDAAANAGWDRLIAAYERGLEMARRELGR